MGLGCLRGSWHCKGAVRKTKVVARPRHHAESDFVCRLIAAWLRAFSVILPLLCNKACIHKLEMFAASLVRGALNPKP